MLELAGSWMEAGGNVRCQLRIAPHKNGLTESSFFLGLRMVSKVPVF